MSGPSRTALALELERPPDDRDAAEGRPEICVFCGAPELLDLLDVWSEDRAFGLETCCEAAHEAWTDEMRQWQRKEWSAFFATRAGLSIRQVVAGSEHCSTTAWPIDFGLELCSVGQAEAKGFVRVHHRHNPPPAGWRWGHGVRNGHELVAVAMVGRPVARALDSAQVVEVSRLCVRSDLEPGLVWNAASMLYGVAAREAKRRGFSRIITYTLEGEAGVALKAAGWKAVARTAGGSWNRPSRFRQNKAPICRKVRWERQLRPQDTALGPAWRGTKGGLRGGARR